MTKFLKGDATAAITLALADGFDYSGKTVHLEYQGARRSFSGVAAGGSLTFSFTAAETAPMSLGAYPVRVWMEDENGGITTIKNADVKLCVTDSAADVHSDGAIYLDVRGGLYGIEGLPERYTDEDLRRKIHEILRRLGGTVAAFALAILPAFGATVDVQTAPKGTIYNDEQVVTNVVLDVSDLATTGNVAVASAAAKEYTDAAISGKQDALPYPTNAIPWTAVSQRPNMDEYATTGQLATAVGAIPAPDFTVSNDTLVATIEAFSPTKVSQLKNDAGYIAEAKYEDYDYWQCILPDAIGNGWLTNRFYKTTNRVWVGEDCRIVKVVIPSEESVYYYTLELLPSCNIQGESETYDVSVVVNSFNIGNTTFTHYVGTTTNHVLYTDATNGLASATALSDVRSMAEAAVSTNTVQFSLLAELADEIALLSSNVQSCEQNATAASAAASTNAANIATVRSIVNLWEGYWDGTNVIFEVTNYYGNTSGELPRLRIKELREGAWHTVWDEANKFAVCETQIVAIVAASNAACRAGCAADLATGLAGRAPLAWGTVTDKGSPNVVSNSVWMTAPETYFAGGTEYQRVAVGSGTICVLVDNGAGTYTAGEEGTFRFQDEGGTNYFGFAKSDSYTIGCRTDGITVSGTLVTLRYDVIMGGTDVPIVYYRQSLTSGEWVQLNNADGTATQGAPYTVTWYTTGGSYYAAINCGENSSGFFKAETSVAGDVVFETNMKARLDGGIECPNTATGVMGVIRPTFNGSTVIWNWSAR